MDGDRPAAAVSAGCPFCSPDPARIVAGNGLAVALGDAYPVSPGHTLIVPRRHVPDWWSLTVEERRDVLDLLDRVKAQLDAEAAPDGYNVGFNAGAAAGQTVFHAHVHVIPRFDGDDPDPRGGVRRVLPDTSGYLTHADPPPPRDGHAGPQSPHGRLDEPRDDAPQPRHPAHHGAPTHDHQPQRRRPPRRSSNEVALNTGLLERSNGAGGPDDARPHPQPPGNDHPTPPPPAVAHAGSATPGAGVAAAMPSGDRSAVEEALVEAGPPPDAASVLQQILALLHEGHRSATYKPALLLALVELATERVAGPAELRLPLADVAERLMELYWPQTRHHPAAEHGTLRQTTNSPSRVVGALLALRRESGAGAAEPIGRVRLTHPRPYNRAVNKITQALAKQPVPRLQRPGKGNVGEQYPRFLFDDSDYVAEAGWSGEGPPTITLRPGVAEALARGAPLLRIAAQDIWTREVGAINRLHLREQELRAFLFGSQRTQLAGVAESLRDAGVDACFWCHRRLRGTEVEVDHVIPWSHYPNDDLFNLVLTDPRCNNDKRDRLVTAALVDRWTQRDLGTLAGLAEALHWPMDPTRSGLVARSAYRYLPHGVPVWQGRNDLRPFDEPQRSRIEQALGLVLS